MEAQTAVGQVRVDEDQVPGFAWVSLETGTGNWIESTCYLTMGCCEPTESSFELEKAAFLGSMVLRCWLRQLRAVLPICQFASPLSSPSPSP